MQTSATVDETCYHLQYVYILTQFNKFERYEFNQNSSSGSKVKLKQWLKS